MTHSIRTALAVIALLAVVGAYVYGRSDGRELERKKALEAAMQQVAEIRAEEQRRMKAQSEIANETKKELEQARADARAADTAAGRLRNRVAELTTRTNHPAASGDCAAAERTGLLLADVFRRADERAGELAEYADRAKIAGRACEASYGALR